MESKRAPDQDEVAKDPGALTSHPSYTDKDFEGMPYLSVVHLPLGAKRGMVVPVLARLSGSASRAHHVVHRSLNHNPIDSVFYLTDWKIDPNIDFLNASAEPLKPLSLIFLTHLIFRFVSSNFINIL